MQLPLWCAFILFGQVYSFQQIKSYYMINSKRQPFFLLRERKIWRNLIKTSSRSASPVAMIQVQTILLIVQRQLV